MSTSPGNVEIHQAESRYSRPSCTMPPQDGVGGWMPRPRKESVASSTMARANSRVAITTIEESTLGSTWRSTTRASEPAESVDGLHELARAQHQHLRAQDAGVGDPA